MGLILFSYGLLPMVDSRCTAGESTFWVGHVVFSGVWFKKNECILGLFCHFLEHEDGVLDYILHER